MMDVKSTWIPTWHQMDHVSWSFFGRYERLRAHDHYTSSTLIGGKGGAGPSLLHTALEGPTDYVIAR
jgi:hypothetical protein